MIADAPDAKSTFGVFTNPEPVTIVGYTQDAMEPFISPDGNYLFFNNSNSLATTNLYYATRIDDVTFQFQGEIVGANSGVNTLTAVPSMDMNDNFYFVSTRSYPQTLSTIYSGYVFERQPVERRARAGSFKAETGRRKFRSMHQSRRQHALLRRRRLHRWQRSPKRQHRDRHARRRSVCASQEEREDHGQGQHPRPQLRARRLQVGTRVLLDSDSDSGFAAQAAAGDLYRDAIKRQQAVWQAAQDRSDHWIRGSARRCRPTRSRSTSISTWTGRSRSTALRVPDAHHTAPLSRSAPISSHV